VPDKWTQERIGVFLVAESQIARQGAHWIMSQEEDIDVVGQAGSADEAFSVTGNITPKTVVLRAIPPNGNFEVVYRLREISPEVSVIVLAEYEDDEGLFQAIVTGASAFLTKETSNEQLLTTIRRVASGEKLVGHKILVDPVLPYEFWNDFRSYHQWQQSLSRWLHPFQVEKMRCYISLPAGIQSKPSLALSTSISKRLRPM